MAHNQLSLNWAITWIILHVSVSVLQPVPQALFHPFLSAIFITKFCAKSLAIGASKQRLKYVTPREAYSNCSNSFFSIHFLCSANSLKRIVDYFDLIFLAKFWLNISKFSLFHQKLPEISHFSPFRLNLPEVHTQKQLKQSF